mmetsp:Transcript_49650/g.127655  ORF Transcript_49650/g.127655 Transcript_49650/m.127655 type:complete len:288 (-) Transcript_49650:619-1482(-)
MAARRAAFALAKLTVNGAAPVAFRPLFPAFAQPLMFAKRTYCAPAPAAPATPTEALKAEKTEEKVEEAVVAQAEEKIVAAEETAESAQKPVAEPAAQAVASEERYFLKVTKIPRPVYTGFLKDAINKAGLETAKIFPFVRIYDYVPSFSGVCFVSFGSNEEKERAKAAFADAIPLGAENISIADATLKEFGEVIREKRLMKNGSEERSVVLSNMSKTLPVSDIRHFLRGYDLAGSNPVMIVKDREEKRSTGNILVRCKTSNEAWRMARDLNGTYFSGRFITAMPFAN